MDVFRALLALAFVVLFVAGLSLPGRPGTVLIGAAGVTVVASSYVLGLFFLFSLGGSNTGWGWELIMLLEGVALLAYAAVELEPGPAYLTFVVLAVFALTAASAGGLVVEGGDETTPHTLVGWPLALGIGTALTAVWGLRGRPAS